MPHKLDGGELSRVTPEGERPTEGASPTAAWSALYCAAQRGRVTAMCGARLFGLSDKRVLRLLAALPDANRCERFCGWPGDRPCPPALVRYVLANCTECCIRQWQQGSKLDFHAVVCAYCLCAVQPRCDLCQAASPCVTQSCPCLATQTEAERRQRAMALARMRVLSEGAEPVIVAPATCAARKRRLTTTSCCTATRAASTFIRPATARQMRLTAAPGCATSAKRVRSEPVMTDHIAALTMHLRNMARVPIQVVNVALGFSPNRCGKRQVY